MIAESQLPRHRRGERARFCDPFALRPAAPWENFAGYSCDDSCKRESFTSLEATGKETLAQSPGRNSRGAKIIARGSFERREARQGADEPDKTSRNASTLSQTRPTEPTPIFGVQAKSGRSTNGHFASE